MLTHKYKRLQQVVKQQLKALPKRALISPTAFDNFIGAILKDERLEQPEMIYCRDGFVFINPVDASTFQLACFQVNYFGTGIFGEKAVKFCTPVLLTLKAHGRHQYLAHSLRDSSISMDAFYLGKHYGGSKGPLCDRDKFNENARKLFMEQPGYFSYNHRTAYCLTNANYLCHHIAEVVGYAFGAIDVFWRNGQTAFHMAAGSHFHENGEKLHIAIHDDFAGDKMNEYFMVPHYAKLSKHPERFHEAFDSLTWEVTYRGQIETFLLPIGYQKVHQTKFNKPVNVVTSQHILQHLLQDYYHRPNGFIVSNTFQTLEYLSRAMLAKKEGHTEEFAAYMKTATFCQGYYPDRDFVALCDKQLTDFPKFESEFAHNMFFRAPLLH